MKLRERESNEGFMGGSEGGNKREEIIQYILISKNKRNSFKRGDLLERLMDYGVYTMAASHWILRI